MIYQIQVIINENELVSIVDFNKNNNLKTFLITNLYKKY